MNCPSPQFCRNLRTKVAFSHRLPYPAGAMKHLFVLLAVISLGLSSCERHEWESNPPKDTDTNRLFKHEGGDDHKKDEEKENKDETPAKSE